MARLVKSGKPNQCGKLAKSVKSGKMVKPVWGKRAKMLKPPGPKIDTNGKSGKIKNCDKTANW